MKSNEESIIDNSIFRVGHVFSIEGRTIKISVDKGKNSSYILYKGDILQNISVGGYIKIVKGFVGMIGKIEGESISEDKNVNEKEYKNSKEKINRYLIVKLLGYIEDGKFTRGIRELPLINNECFLLKRGEFNLIHNFVPEGDVGLEIGELTYDEGQRISIGVDGIFASHLGIFGNTGSGKSYTLAKIYYELFNKYKRNPKFLSKSKFYFLDFNGEYTGENTLIEANFKKTYILSTRTVGGLDKYPIKKETLSDTVFWTIFLEATEKTQTPFIKRAIGDNYLYNQLNTDEDFKEIVADKLYTIVSDNDRRNEKSLVNDFLFELSLYLDNNVSIREAEKFFKDNLKYHGVQATFYMNDGNKDRYANGDKEYFRDLINSKISTFSVDIKNLTPIRKIGLVIILKYYEEMIRGFSNREHISPLIKRLEKRVKDLEKVIEVGQEDNQENISIVSLKDVNIDIRKMIPMLICKELYDIKKRDNDDEKSLHIIIDEAHNILSRNSDRESEQWKDYRLETFEEIIKEGRKFGVFLTVASQRPSDISPTIISQLHNYFLHRLINNNDIIAVEKTISYLDKVSTEQLSILPTGTCVLAGLFAQIPITININPLKNSNRPKNDTIKLTKCWE